VHMLRGKINANKIIGLQGNETGESERGFK
jgi:hypothetical protein